jgi:hypothetical protein
MPDISMCMGKNCERKETCYRYKAYPSPHWQAYGDFDSGDVSKCGYYWKVTNEPVVPERITEDPS